MRGVNYTGSSLSLLDTLLAYNFIQSDSLLWRPKMIGIIGMTLGEAISLSHSCYMMGCLPAGACCLDGNKRPRKTKIEVVEDFITFPIPSNVALGGLGCLEWLRTQHWWDFNEMDFLMLITAYGMQGDFIKAERVLSYMNKKGYAPGVVSHTALMEPYGRGGQTNKAEAIFRRMQTSGPEPSALTY
ncbi:hypothetical protein Ancab_030004 [Ancistrocladus abbreviatus]